MLSSYFMKLEKQPPEVFYKYIYKILQYSRENYRVIFLRTPILNKSVSACGCFWTDFMKWLFGNVSGSYLKPSSLSDIASRFQTKALKFGAYAVYIFNPYAFLWTQVSYVHHYRLLHKKQTLVVLGLFVERCDNILLCVLD